MSSGESIDDEDTEIDEDFVKMRKLFRESKDQKFIRKLKKKLKENLLKKQNGESSESSSDNERPKVDYPEPFPKLDRNKKAGTVEPNSIKKSGPGGNSGAKNNPVSKPLKKMEDLKKAATDRWNHNPASSLNPKSSQQSKNDKKDDHPTNFDKKADSDNKNNDKPKKEHKRNAHDVPRTKNDRDITKNEVEAMIRMVLKQSREEGGNADDIEDVSLGETESIHSGDELDIGEDPELPSTPDELSSETISDEEDNVKDFVY